MELEDYFESLSDEEKDELLKSWYNYLWVGASGAFHGHDELFVKVPLKGIDLYVPDSCRDDILSILMTAYGVEIKRIEDKKTKGNNGITR
jgi:hypothetical protein